MSRGRNVPLWTAIVATVAAIGLLAMHLWVRPLPGLDALDGLSIDARFKIRGPRAPESDRVVIVGLDDETRRAYPEVFQTRRGWAQLIRALTKYEVKVIALDLFFSAPEVFLPADLDAEVRAADAEVTAATDPVAQKLAGLVHRIANELRGDEVLAQAIAESKRVFLGAFFRPGVGAPREAEPKTLVPARHGESADAGGGGSRRPVHAVAVDTTLDSIGGGAIGAGALNAFRDPDGVTRRVPLAIELGGRHYMPLGLAVALYDLGKPGDTRYLAGDGGVTAAGMRLPVGIAASVSLDMLGRGKLPRVSAAQVLAGTAPPSALAGKLVFVGMTYSAYDKVQTPLDPVADGVELHATLAENVLARRTLHLAGPLATVLATLALCGIVIAAQLRRVRRRAYVPPLVALAAMGGYVVVAQLAFGSGLILAIAAPIVMTVLVLAAATIGGLATEGREKAHLRAVFSQYVSKTVVDKVLADPARARLGGERKELTVLFSDIRGFSAFAEGMGPEALASFLGEYLTPMTDLVLESGGTLDKYIGDAVMAIWAAPVDLPDHAARACEVALRMQEALVGLNKKWKAEGKPEVAIGIGINTGPMSVGNMGTHARFDYTVLGDQVNLGARLEALTKEYGVDILVGEATAKAAGPAYVFREVDVVRVKGRAGAAPVFELVGRVGVKVDDRFQAALAAYRRREFSVARETFTALAGDATAEIMAKRCAELAAAPPPEDWDGVYEQRSK
ncbi:MAG: adenylate/guanylate cyclase domain-containing protein [Kofleriaceae bacterium]|nr:adenylate/guanylate cyclase domain-containing protein [Kofleriaceae bacterium]